MDAPFQIRPATEADLPAIAALERRCFADPWSADSFRAFLRGAALLAEDGSDLLGYVFALHAADVGEILNIAVAPEARRRGIGAALVERACALLVGLGADTVFLEVRESNVAAQALYRGLGFSAVGRRRRYYRRPLEDALVLARLFPGGNAADGAAEPG